MVRVQGGACAICRQVSDGTLHVDHDHETGKVRGLLCFDCNTAIAKLGDSLSGVLAATDYLIRSLVQQVPVITARSFVIYACRRVDSSVAE